MFRIGAWLLIALCFFHMGALSIEAIPYAPGWLSGQFWTMEHWRPLADQSPEMLLSGLAFWFWPGSLAIPIGVLAALLLWLDNRMTALPRFPMIILTVWMLVMAGIMPNSGFPLVLLASVLMLLGRPRGGWA